MKAHVKFIIVSNFVFLSLFSQHQETQMPDPPFTNPNQELGSSVRLHNPAGDMFAAHFPIVSPNFPNFHLTELALPPPFGTGGTNFRVFQVFVGTTNCSTPLTQLNNGVGVNVIEVDPLTLSINLAQLAMTGASNEGMWFGMIDRMVCWTPFASKKFFPFPANSAGPPSKPIIVQQSGTSNYFICGQFDKFIYVVKVDGSGNLLWSQCYTHPLFGPGDIIPNGMILDPYSPGDVVIVGKILTNSGGTDGFFMKVGGNSGMINLLNTYSQQLGNGYDVFNSISMASFSGVNNGQGYILGGASGITPLPNNASPSLVKLDPNGNVIWSKTVQSSTDPMAKGMLSVLERQNANMNRLEYYGVFQSKLGNIVAKMDEYGSPIHVQFPSENSEFPYNIGSGQLSKPIGITIEDGALTAPTTGLHAFGSLHTNNSNNIHFVSAFFNGITGCTTPVNLLNSTAVNCVSNPDVLISATALNSCSQINIVNIGNGWGWNACLGSTSSGSNMRAIHNSKGERLSDEEIEKGILDDQFEIYPNPTSGNLKINSSDQSRSVNLKIVDVTGKLVFSKEMRASDPKTIDISSLKASLYLIEIENEAGQIVRKKLVKE